MTQEELLKAYEEAMIDAFPHILREFMEWFYDPDRDLYSIGPFPEIPKKYPIVPYKGDTDGPPISG